MDFIYNLLGDNSSLPIDERFKKRQSLLGISDEDAFQKMTFSFFENGVSEYRKGHKEPNACANLEYFAGSISAETFRKNLITFLETDKALTYLLDHPDSLFVKQQKLWKVLRLVFAKSYDDLNVAMQIYDNFSQNPLVQSGFMGELTRHISDSSLEKLDKTEHQILKLPFRHPMIGELNKAIAEGNYKNGRFVKTEGSENLILNDYYLMINPKAYEKAYQFIFENPSSPLAQRIGKTSIFLNIPRYSISKFPLLKVHFFGFRVPKSIFSWEAS